VLLREFILNKLLLIILLIAGYTMLLIVGCSSPDCSNRAAWLNSYYKYMNVNTYIAVCPYGKGKSHAYMFVNNRFYDSVTLYRVQRSLEGCIIFDDPETLKPYMSKKTWEKEWKF
jgi:hypothetical protein